MNELLIPMLAASVSADADAVIKIVIQIVVIGLIFWLLWWLLNYVNPPEPFKKVGIVLLALVGVVLLIRILLQFL